MTETNQKAITSAFNMSGGLFQRHPDAEHWKTTRPVSPEIACFKHEPSNSYIRVEFWREGEEDEDGYEWHSTGYLIETLQADGYYPRTFFTDVEEAVDHIDEEMAWIDQEFA